MTCGGPIKRRCCDWGGCSSHGRSSPARELMLHWRRIGRADHHYCSQIRNTVHHSLNGIPLWANAVLELKVDPRCFDHVLKSDWPLGLANGLVRVVSRITGRWTAQPAYWNRKQTVSRSPNPGAGTGAVSRARNTMMRGQSSLRINVTAKIAKSI
jgi:hypothetical protein